MSAVLAEAACAEPRADLDIALQGLARAAVAALHDELTLEPKPGLVSPRDSGSHSDMDAATLMRSLFALRHAYRRLAALGAAGAGFDALAASGRVAEARMLRATGGVNTHRGAIFCLGLLCASGGALLAQGRPLQPAALRETLLRRWGAALVARELAESRFKAAMAPVASSVALPQVAATPSHGRAAAQAHGLRGANAEAAAGFPVLFETTLPTLQGALAGGWTMRQARLQALFATMAVLDDTNLVHRGGLDGLRSAQGAARDWLAAGGAGRPGALDAARALHREFVARRLSPGGSADLLAAACWVQRVGGPAPGADLRA